METDVLVVGGGIAACMAAIAAGSRGADTVLVDKAHTGRSGNSPLMSGVLTVFDPEQDNYDDWLRRCVHEGEYMNEQDVLAQVITEIPRVVRQLQDWGVVFMKQGDRLHRFRSIGGQMNAKLANGGLQLMDVVRGEAVKKAWPVQRVMMVDLLTSDGRLPTGGRVVGAIGFSLKTGKLHVFKAKATVLATGGVALRRYSPFLHSADGIMAAFRAGCQLKNLELTEANYAPANFNVAAGANLLLGQGGYLLNRLGERFMARYEPEHMERSPRSVTAVAIARECREGRGPVFLDVRHLDVEAHQAIRRGMPIYVRSLERAGLDLTRDLIEYKNRVSPCLGAGGIRVDLRRAASIEGLYAAGSSADHAEGGSESGISSGMESAVAGAIAGQSAAEYAVKADRPEVRAEQVEMLARRISGPMGEGGVDFHEISQEIAAIWEPMEVVRSAAALAESIERIEQIKAEKMPRLRAGSWHDLAGVLGAVNKLAFLELMCRTALVRTESRGGHFRLDHPERRREWLKWVICQQRGDDLALWTEPVPFDRYPLKPPGEGL
ncbi:MAG: FAD-binding protein [Chloroflexi bacterium]|nr:FAD-binding protein [Chloroflexota bacterium]